MSNSFADLGVAEPVRRALDAAGYTDATPIQTQSIPLLLEGRDMLGLAQTGTGKTAAFSVPILQRLAEGPRRKDRGPSALILSPTRELALQIAASIRIYGQHLRLRESVVFGGVGLMPQIRALQSGVDVLVATPGRLLDLMNQGHARLGHVRMLVLDEADRMLDMGFIRDVKRIVAALPKQRQSMLFSATMPAEITSLADHILHDPVRVEVTPNGSAVEQVAQSVFHVSMTEKRALLPMLLQDPDMRRVIVFTRTKHAANRISLHLMKCGIPASAIHGNKSQSARQAALEDFRIGKVRVLVATDIAARGIDVKNVTHIVNFDLPNVPETYVHRIGRTARAGADGVAMSFCDPSERPFLRDIEKLIRKPIPVAPRPQEFRGTAEHAPAPAQTERPSSREAPRETTHETPRDAAPPAKRKRSSRNRRRYRAAA